MSQKTDAILTLSAMLLGVLVSGACGWITWRISRGQMWGVKADRDAATAAELADLRVDQKIHATVAKAIERAVAPVSSAIRENTRILQAVDTRLTRVETVQFGGNSGGIREELNKNTQLTRQLLAERDTRSEDPSS